MKTNTQSTSISTRSIRSSINAKHTIVRSTIPKPTKPKKKPKKKVEISITFSDSCTDNCKCRYSCKPANDIILANQLITEQLQQFKQLKEHDKRCTYIKLSHESGSLLAKSFYLLSKTSYFLYPLSSNPDASNVLCLDCFKRTLGLTNSSTWKRAIAPHARLKDIPTIADSTDNKSKTKILFDLIIYMYQRHRQNNTAVVVTSEDLQHYDHTIILQNPRYKPEKESNKMYYSKTAIVNGVEQELDEATELPQQSVVVVVSKKSMNKCMALNGLKQEYTYHNCKPQDEDTYVILTAISTRDDNPSDFSPSEDDHALFSKYKRPIFPTTQTGRAKVTRKNHFGSEGLVYGHGHTAVYTDKSIGSYATMNQDNSRSFRLFKRSLSSVEHLILSSIGSLNERAHFNLVEHASRTTTQNRDYADMINQLTGIINRSPIVLDALASGTALFPSCNVCINAGTRIFHTEIDQGYTLIMAPYQSLTKQPRFCFKVCPQAILKVPLTNGKNVLFNARLFTHRQDNTGVNNLRLIKFWNVGCYANRKYDNHTHCVFDNELASIFSHISALILAS